MTHGSRAEIVRDFSYTLAMSVFGNIATAAFIEQFWQQQPLLVRGALPGIANLISGNDLAGIACEDGADARIVIEQDENWRCEHGPFAESRFAELPADRWSLLVQSVDQWVPAVAALLAHFKFLPRWRLDDIMISVSADGGGVGPHFDYYDVFLIQAAGLREWRIGQDCDGQTPLREDSELHQLQNFEQRDEHLLTAGDLLYVPPGVAHWGIARGDESITISIGFRAPSYRDLLLGAADQLANGLAESQRYQDSEASIDPEPHRINGDAIEQLLAAWPGEADSTVRTALSDALGTQATEPRNPDYVEADASWTTAKLDTCLAGDAALTIECHPASRIAWYAASNSEPDAAKLFVDGHAYVTTIRFARALCRGHLLATQIADRPERRLLHQLLRAGSLLVKP